MSRGPRGAAGSSLHGAARTVLSCLCCCLCCRCRCPDSWGQGKEGPSATSSCAPCGAGWWGQGSCNSHLLPRGHRRHRAPSRGHHQRQARGLGRRQRRAQGLHLEGSRAVRPPPKHPLPLMVTLTRSLPVSGGLRWALHTSQTSCSGDLGCAQDWDFQLPTPNAHPDTQELGDPRDPPRLWL